MGDQRMGWRPAFSIITGVGWLSFVIIWLFFFADRYGIYQNIAVLIVSVLILAGLNGLVWAVWGLRFAPSGWWRGAGWRGILSMISVLGWLIFLVAWLFRYASEFSVFQNIAVFIVSILIVGGINAAIWTTWRQRRW